MAKKVSEMTIVIDKRTGRKKRLMNPSETGNKYAVELKRGIHLTNFGKPKTNKYGVVRKLTDTQKSYRSGYLKARKDNARAWNYRKGNKSNTNRSKF